MRLRSKGLGRREMVMDFREYEVVIEGNELVVVGIIRDPVTWDFSIRFCEDDYPAVFKLAFHPQTLKAVFRAMLNRFRSHHWGKERVQHQADGKASLAEVRKTVQERVQNAVRPFDAPTKTMRRTRNGLVAVETAEDIEAEIEAAA
ncbi:protein of unknown function [Sterolibacterium denitrificans]|uniref:Uncharacterized protein n=2 Tax=Sterolibacterium denitrificans TaxID=157592 RepID=A0A7Z7HT45_9PROT|nr:hypothetical protein [Sterolibacterium denitrificans]KYC29499.1 hypothetical protein ACY05_03125 [Sterolibacterium denitrificans]SMB32005.1 protein of unknown function [Sterolibacterium denitrificans]